MRVSTGMSWRTKRSEVSKTCSCDDADVWLIKARATDDDRNMAEKGHDSDEERPRGKGKRR
jgi:hypothetical protein